MQTTGSRFFLLDLIRAVAILYIVFFWHLLDYIPGVSHQNPVTVSLTVLVLAAFTFVSGYLAGGDQRPVWEFYKRKLARLYPLYLVAVLLFWALRIDPEMKVIRDLFMLSVFSTHSTLTLWYLQMLFWFYLITPTFKQDAVASSVLFFGVFILCFVVGLRFDVTLIDYRVLIYFPMYVLGLMLYGRVDLSGFRKPDRSWIFAWITRISQASYVLYLFHRPIFTLIFYSLPS